MSSLETSLLTGKELVLKERRVFPIDETFKTQQLQTEHRAVTVTSIFFQQYEGLSNPTPDVPVQVREKDAVSIACPGMAIHLVFSFYFSACLR